MESLEKRFFSKKDLQQLRGLLENNGKKVLLYHSDPDGICAAAMFVKSFSGLETIPRKGPGMQDEFVKELLAKEPSVIIALDLPIDQEVKAIKKLRKSGAKIAIIDHHIFEKNLNPDCLHLNPRFRNKGVYIPAACMAYRLLEGMGFKTKPMLWIAAAGVIGDHGMRDCWLLLQEAKKESPYLFRKEPKQSEIMKACDTIAATVTVSGLKGAGMCLKALKAAEGFEDFTEDAKLIGMKKEFDGEFEHVVSGFKKEHVEHTKKVWSYEIKSAYSITSIVSNHFGFLYPDNIIIIKRQTHEGWKVSVRGQNSKLNLGEIVKKSVKGLGKGGGHERAAAGLVSDWDKFIKRFVKLAKE